MKSSIDTRPPAPQPHLTLYGRDYAAKKRATTEAAFSDLKMIQSIAKTMTRKPYMPQRKGPVSLNADGRKQEIFRIMKENHRLLDRLECLEPVVSTADLVRSHKERQRYTILVSHSKRLAGEYDPEIHQIRTEDKAKQDAMNRSVHLRLTKQRMAASTGNMTQSMPALTPLSASGPAVLEASPKPEPKKRTKPVVTKSLNTVSGQSSSSSAKGPSSPGTSAPAAPPSSLSVEASSEPAPSSADVEKKVSFTTPKGDDKNPSSGSFSRGQPTPHPKKVSSELLTATEEEAAPAASEPAAEVAAAAEEAPPSSEPTHDGHSRELPEHLKPAEEAAPEAPPEATSRELPADLFAAAPAAEEKEVVGVTGAAAPADGAKDEYEEYEDDFADQTANSLSQAVGAPDESGTFEDESGTFEDSKG